jgi:soluble lytic murein transglycosylase
MRWLRIAAGLIVAAVIVVIGVRALGPLAQKAIRDLTLPIGYSTIIRQQATAKDLDPALIAAVIYAETGFEARTSPTGAEGLMQIEPATAEFLAHKSGATDFQVSDLWEPSVNIAYGSYYLRYLLDQYDGDVIAALAAYNGGTTNVATWMSNARAAGHHFGLDDIPFPQTRAYVTKVMGAENEYRQKYAAQLYG